MTQTLLLKAAPNRQVDIHRFFADGFHRVKAAQIAGWQEIPAEVVQGSRRDAILHAIGANASHWLRRTNADKRARLWSSSPL